MKKTLWLLLGLILMGGCADLPYPSGSSSSGVHAKYSSEVQIVPALSATESGQFRRVATLNCQQDLSLDTPNHPFSPEQVCESRFLEDAFKQGADVVVITSKETIACRYPVDKGPCVKMTAAGYRRLD